MIDIAVRDSCSFAVPVRAPDRGANEICVRVGVLTVPSGAGTGIGAAHADWGPTMIVVSAAAVANIFAVLRIQPNTSPSGVPTGAYG